MSQPTAYAEPPIGPDGLLDIATVARRIGGSPEVRSSGIDLAALDAATPMAPVGPLGLPVAQPTPAPAAPEQPKVSDHDYEVFIPRAYTAQAACVVDALNKAGEDADLGDVSFFAVAKEEFVSGKLNIDPPSGGGADATGDLGLGRQSLLLKWALEGEYVTGVAGLPQAAIPLATVLNTLRTTPFRASCTRRS